MLVIVAMRLYLVVVVVTYYELIVYVAPAQSFTCGAKGYMIDDVVQLPTFHRMGCKMLE